MKPFKHQLVSLKHAETTPAVFDCSDPGTGKSAVAIWDFSAKRTRRQAKRALIIAPKSLLRAVWYNDFKKFAPHLKVAVTTTGKHDETFQQDADVYVINHDAVKWLVDKGKKYVDKLDYLVVDESTAFKHHTSMRSKALAKLAKKFKYRRFLTGTPNSNSITDVWHQVFLLDDGKRLGRSFFAFRNAVCTPIQRGYNAAHVQWVDKDGAEEAVFALLQDIVIRHRFEECVDIPENHMYSVTYTMPAAQRRVYEEMRKQSVVDLSEAKTITAINAAAQTGKMLQIASGAVYTGKEEEYHVVDDSRYELILDLVEERQHSVVMFLWKHQRDVLLKKAEERGLTFAVIDGSVPDFERSAIVNRYQNGEYRVLFAHPKSAGHGLTLTRGTATIWASPTYDLEIFKQGSRRLYRIGQTQKTETIVVLAENSIDEWAYAALQRKNSRMETLLDYFQLTKENV